MSKHNAKNIKKGDIVIIRKAKYIAYNEVEYSYSYHVASSSSKKYLTAGNMRFHKYNACAISKSSDCDHVVFKGNETKAYIDSIKPVLVVSLSGGHTSGYLALLLDSEFDSLKKYYSKLDCIFANTGDEYEETLEYVDRLSKRLTVGITWIEAVVNKKRGIGTSYRVVNFSTASRQGKPLIDISEKYGVYNITRKHCTRESKMIPILKNASATYNNYYRMCVGIRVDEMTREGSERDKKIYKLCYPLLDNNIYKDDIIDFWENDNDALTIENYKGNCKTCFHKSIKKLAVIYFDDKNAFNTMKFIENNYSDHGRFKGDIPKFYRGHKTVKHIINECKLLVNDRESRDRVEKEIVKNYDKNRSFSPCAEDCNPFS